MRFVNRCFQVLILAGSIQAALIFSLVSSLASPRNALEWALIIFACGTPALLSVFDSATSSAAQRKGVRLTALGGSIALFPLAWVLAMPMAGAFLLCALLMSSLIILFAPKISPKQGANDLLG